MTDEDRLLLLAARAEPDDRVRAGLAAIVQRRLDWASVLARSVREGTAPLLYANLVSLDAGTFIPPAVRARLAALSGASWARNSVLLDRWAEVVTLLADGGVPSLTLKGAALVQTVYPDLALRPMTDVDLLIRPGDRALASRLLRDAGYRTVGDAIEAEQASHGFRLFARDSTVIDLHWALAYASRMDGVVCVDHDGLWRRARRLDVEGVAWATLSAEDMLLHLALHLTIGSEFARLIWFSDIDVLVRRETLDWDRVLAKAERWRVRGILGYVLGVVRVAFDTPVPGDVWGCLRPGRVRRAAIGACIGTAEPPSLRDGIGDTRVYLAETLLMDRLRDVARVLGRSVFPTAAWTRRHYSLPADSPALFHRLVVHPARVCYLAVRRLT